MFMTKMKNTYPLCLLLVVSMAGSTLSAMQQKKLPRITTSPSASNEGIAYEQPFQASADSALGTLATHMTTPIPNKVPFERYIPALTNNLGTQAGINFVGGYCGRFWLVQKLRSVMPGIVLSLFNVPNIPSTHAPGISMLQAAKNSISGAVSLMAPSIVQTAMPYVLPTGMHAVAAATAGAAYLAHTYAASSKSLVPVLGWYGACAGLMIAQAYGINPYQKKAIAKAQTLKSVADRAAYSDPNTQQTTNEIIAQDAPNPTLGIVASIGTQVAWYNMLAAIAALKVATATT